MPEQSFAISQGQTRIACQHRMSPFERLLIALLLILTPQLFVLVAVTTAETLDCFLNLRFEVRLATVNVIESARDFASDLHVCDLVLANRHVRGLVQENVCAL